MKLSICLLSWKSHHTLLQTLESYERNGLLRLADEKLIFFQQMSARDARIAHRYGLKAYGSDRNLGIGAGYYHLAERATGDAILFLQNDFVLVEDLGQDASELKAGLRLLESQEADVVLYRHRRHPGEPHWAETHVKGNEERWQSHLFNSLYWLENPEKVYPTKIWRSPTDPRFLLTTSRYANYTDNPSLYRRDWLRQTLSARFVANGFDQITWPELVIQPWWENQDFRVAQAGGLFTHIRLDRHGWGYRLLRAIITPLKWIGLFGHFSRNPLVRKLRSKIIPPNGPETDHAP